MVRRDQKRDVPDDAGNGQTFAAHARFASLRRGRGRAKALSRRTCARPRTPTASSISPATASKRASFKPCLRSRGASSPCPRRRSSRSRWSTRRISAATPGPATSTRAGSRTGASRSTSVPNDRASHFDSEFAGLEAAAGPEPVAVRASRAEADAARISGEGHGAGGPGAAGLLGRARAARGRVRADLRAGAEPADQDHPLSGPRGGRERPGGRRAQGFRLHGGPPAGPGRGSSGRGRGRLDRRAAGPGYLHHQRRRDPRTRVQRLSARQRPSGRLAARRRRPAVGRLLPRRPARLRGSRARPCRRISRPRRAG